MKAKTICILSIILILLICSISACDSVDKILKPELPENYKLLCSPEGKYSLQFPGGRRSANVWDSKRKAISFAIYWEQVGYISYITESDKYTWTICETSKNKENKQ